MSRRTLFGISLVLLMVLVIGLLGACSKSTPTTSAPPVTTAAPTTAAATTPVQATNTTNPPTTSAPTPQNPITLVFNEIEPPGSFWDVNIAQPWFAEVAKRTNGRVKFEAHWGGELVGLFDAYDAVQKGTVDISKILPTMFGDKFPMDGVMIFTPVNLHPWKSGAAWLELYNEFPEMQAQYQNTPLVALAPTPCFGFATTKKMITKYEDARGLKMVAAGPAPESRQKAVGIVPTSLQPTDAYMMLKTGTLDGISVIMHSLKDFKWGDVLPYMANVNINGGPWAYAMSQKAWNSLPPDIQQVFVDMRPWVTDLVDKVANQMDKESIDTFPALFGTKIYDLSQAELDRWAAVDGPTLDAYIKDFVTAKGLPGDKLKSEFLRVMQKYSAKEYAAY